MIIDADRPSNEAVELLNRLEANVIGQSEAIKEITYATQKYFSQLSPKQKPIMTFLFIGPTGTGKTKVVEEFFNALNPSLEKKDQSIQLIKINCGEYQQSHEIAKIIGSPPGYLGHNETKPVLSKERVESLIPNVILFDEIEKASDSLFNLLLGVLDKAELQLGNNTMVKFNNCFIFMTSNEGIDKLNQESNNIGYHKTDMTDEKREAILQKNLKRKFKPEFLNRIDKIVSFKELSPEDCMKILDLEMEEIQERVNNSVKKIVLTMTNECREWIVKNTFSKEYGARKLKRYLEKEIVVRLSNIIFMDEVHEGDIILIDTKDEKLVFEKIEGGKKIKGNVIKIGI